VKEDESKYLNTLVTKEWQKELAKSNPSLLQALLRAFGPKYAWLGIILIGETVVHIIQAILLGYFVDIIVAGGSSSISVLNNGYAVSALLTLSGIIIGVAHHQYFFYGWRMGMQLRIAVTSMIYDKAVMLHMRALSHTSSSHIVNLSSQDVEAFQQGGVFFHFLYAPLLEALGILVVGVMTVRLFRITHTSRRLMFNRFLQLGWSFLAGFGAVLLLVPLQMFFSRSLTDLRSNLGKNTDQRIKLVSQALSGVRLMKINGWEWAFNELIGIARKQEMSVLMKINNVKGLNEVYIYAHLMPISHYGIAETN
jgi:ABC-type multidrug transport system fused ATPase/permease subunit